LSQPESAPPSRGAVAAADQDLSEAELAELDALLAAVPEPLEPLDVVMLDGFLCGVVVQPVLVDVEAWLPHVFDAGGHRWGEAEPSAEQRRARALVLRRHAALNRALAEHGAFEPFLLESVGDDGEGEADGDGDGDGAAGSEATAVESVGETLQPWILGFQQALQLLPALDELDDPQVASVVERIVGRLPDGAATSTEPVAGSAPPASLDDAVDELVADVAELYELTLPLRYKVEAVRHATPKVGRNDPCPCGSGRKFKLCHGAAGRA
jgi:uncharacterized protein